MVKSGKGGGLESKKIFFVWLKLKIEAKNYFLSFYPDLYY